MVDKIARLAAHSKESDIAEMGQFGEESRRVAPKPDKMASKDVGFHAGRKSYFGYGLHRDNISRNTGQPAVDCDTMKIVPTLHDR